MALERHLHLDVAALVHGVDVIEGGGLGQGGCLRKIAQSPKNYKQIFFLCKIQSEISLQKT